MKARIAVDCAAPVWARHRDCQRCVLIGLLEWASFANRASVLLILAVIWPIVLSVKIDKIRFMIEGRPQTKAQTNHFVSEGANSAGRPRQMTSIWRASVNNILAIVTAEAFKMDRPL